MSGYIGEVLTDWGIWVFHGNSGHSLGIKISSAYNPEAMGGYRSDPILPDTRPDVLRWDRIYRQQPSLLLPLHYKIIGRHYLGPGKVQDKAAAMQMTVRTYQRTLAEAKQYADHLMRLPTSAMAQNAAVV